MQELKDFDCVSVGDILLYAADEKRYMLGRVLTVQGQFVLIGTIDGRKEYVYQRLVRVLHKAQDVGKITDFPIAPKGVMAYHE